MLVVTRREGDQIVFPSLNISIEITRLTRSRVSLGVHAPSRIRVIRHELLTDADYESPGADLADSIRDELKLQIRNEIGVATRRLKRAQQDLIAGKTQEALQAISRSLAELELLQKASADLWSVAKGVAESSAEYVTSSSDDTARRHHRVLTVDVPIVFDNEDPSIAEAALAG